MNRNIRYPRRGTEPCGCRKSQAAERGITDSGNMENADGVCGEQVLYGNDEMNGGETMVLAMAYVKSQPFANLYEPCEALRRGTLFASLDKPFCTGGRRI